MKYVKITTMMFVATALFAVISVSAQAVGVGLTIPAFTGITSTGNWDKDNFGNQTAIKISCRDNLSGNEMAVLGRTYRVNTGTNSDWVSLPKGKDVVISGGANTNPGTYRLQLKAKNSFVTTGSFSGAWNLN